MTICPSFSHLSTVAPPFSPARLARLAAAERALQHLRCAAALRQLHFDQTLGDLLHLAAEDQGNIMEKHGRFSLFTMGIWEF